MMVNKFVLFVNIFLIKLFILVHESSIDHKEELLNIPNTNNSTDTEQ
jgi:hypothetical protein